MPRVGIVIDSASCMPPELIKEYDIHIAPVHLTMDGKDYRDQIDITPAEFWKIFKDSKEMPTTSGVGPADFASAFSELAKSTDSIVCIVVSKVLSATYSAAEQAREMVREEYPNLSIEIFDSKRSVGAQSLIALEAARAAQAGKSLGEVTQVAQDMIPRVKYFLALDTLKYLMKIGRAPKTGMIGELLNVKPIVGMVKDTGVMDNLGRERGKQKALRKIVDMISEHTDISKPLHVIVHYSDNIEDGEQVREMVTAKHNCAEVYMSELSPVVVTATGPMVGLAFYS
jgi:DegV family protein with EDD domain